MVFLAYVGFGVLGLALWGGSILLEQHEVDTFNSSVPRRFKLSSVRFKRVNWVEKAVALVYIAGGITVAILSVYGVVK